MSDNSELVKRLRDMTDEDLGDVHPHSNYGREMVAAADAIETLERERDEARREREEIRKGRMVECEALTARAERAEAALKEAVEALKPFASIAAITADGFPDHDNAFVSLKMCREARAVLEKIEGEK